MSTNLHEQETDDERRRRAHIAANYGGPHGLGDPTDRTLRHVEAEKIIPNMMRNEVQSKCPTEVAAFANCVHKEGQFAMLWRCNVFKDAMNGCIDKWLNDAVFYEETTEEYLADRALYRTSGMSKKERRMKTWKDWKAAKDVEGETQKM